MTNKKNYDILNKYNRIKQTDINYKTYENNIVKLQSSIFIRLLRSISVYKIYVI